jgi:hypothetical protein
VSNKDIIINQLPSYFQSTAFMNDLAFAVGGVLDDISAQIDEIEAQKFFDKITCAITNYEKDLGLTASGTLADRRAKAWAKWKKSSKNTLALLQAVCDFWKEDAVIIKFVNGKFVLNFLDVSTGMFTLLDMLDEAKPAHLDYSGFIQTSKADVNFLALNSIAETIFIPATLTTSIISLKQFPNIGTNSPFELIASDIAMLHAPDTGCADFKCSLKVDRGSNDIEYVYPDANSEEYPTIRIFGANAEIIQPNSSEDVLLVAKKGQTNSCQIYNPSFGWYSGGNYLLEVFASYNSYSQNYWS